jgi:hypothetical protein
VDGHDWLVQQLAANRIQLRVGAWTCCACARTARETGRRAPAPPDHELRRGERAALLASGWGTTMTGTEVNVASGVVD